MIAATYALNMRLDLFLPQKLNPLAESEFRLTRLVSYDNGTSWPDNWATNQVGVLTSSPASAITGDSLDTFVVAKGKDNRFWICHLAEYYELKTLGWSPIGEGVFKGKPAICLHGTSSTIWQQGATHNRKTSYNGVRLNVFGWGLDKKIWWAYSRNGGSKWDMAWKPIGEGVFRASPASVCSADGKFIAVFGLGNDHKIWWAYSTSGGQRWDMAWKPIGEGVFQSMPAAACSADGKRLYVFGRGNDNRFWWAYSTNGGHQWDMAWSPIGEGIFTSPPAACCNWEGRHIHVFGMGTDQRIWQARSNNFGRKWNIAWRQINRKTF